MSQPFFIGAYPRSRTAWVCNYFTAHGHLCLHEPLLPNKTIDATLDLIEKLGCGVCDSSVQLMWPKIKERFPDAPAAFITRADWFTCPSLKNVPQWAIDALFTRSEPMINDMLACSQLFNCEDLDDDASGIVDLATHCVPDFKKNELIHNQCLRFHVQLTDVAVKEVLAPFEKKEAA